MSLGRPDVLWAPSPETVRASRMGAFAQSVADRRNLDFGSPCDYDQLWQWSVTHLDQFWADIAEWSGVLPGVPDNEVLARRDMPGAVWFPGRTVNYAEQALCHHGTAIVAADENNVPIEISWAELRGQVGALAATLRRLGVRPGDRVAGYLPNVPQTVVAFLAAASIGAIWCACAPDFGTDAVLDRFAQVEPVLLITVDGYRFNGRDHDRRSVVTQLLAALPTVRCTISVPFLYPDQVGASALSWADATAGPCEPVFEQLPFDHPLWIVYSSGTTGLPKGIVHGHGGVVLEHLKQTGLHMDVRPGDRLFWYTSTAWMMWNVVVSALLCGATAVLYDGAPVYPAKDAQFALAARTRTTHLGSGAAYLAACEKSGLRPATDHDLSCLRFVGSTGSPLPASTFRWVYDAVSPQGFLGSFSGGTDVVTSFIGGTLLLPVTAGQLQRPLLGVAAAAWDEAGRQVTGEVGELVVTEPMPSMPLYFWNDIDGTRYRATYFEPWPGVWRHGDWLQITDSGACVITGRSDSTLNRGGIRMGTADIYAAIGAIPAVQDCVVLGVELPEGGYWMPLFVQLVPDQHLSAALVDEIKEAIRSTASPRHVPDEVIAVPALPHTRTGKRLEVPLKRLFQGVDPAKAVTVGAVDDASSIDYFVRLARERLGTGE